MPKITRHEDPGVLARAVFYLAGALAGLVLAALAFSGAVQAILRAVSGARPVPPFAEPRPPEPRLQVDPAADLRALRERDERLLGGYGWIDRDRGIARIPIHRAMELLSRRGLPARPASEKAGEEAAR